MQNVNLAYYINIKNMVSAVIRRVAPIVKNIGGHKKPTTSLLARAKARDDLSIVDS